MSEAPIANAITSALAEALMESGSMLTGFCLVGSAISADGSVSLVVANTPDQPTHLSLGFLSYAQEWYRDDVRYQIAALSEDEE